MPPLLSICIPTYRRPNYLSECLDSLAREDLADVEIVVRDNCSGDATEEVLRKYQATLGIRYEIARTNEGPDRNFGNVLRTASGQYTWLLGDDDVVRTGMLSAIKRELTAKRPLILQLGFVQANSTLEPLRTVMPVYGGMDENGSIVDKSAYIEAQSNISVLFAFISSYVFARACWDHGDSAEKWYGTCYVQMYQMHSALAAAPQPRIAHLSEPGIIARGNVPSGINNNIGAIMWLDAQTLANLSRTVYGDEVAYRRAFSNVFRKVYSLRTIASVLAQTGKTIDKSTASALIYLGFSSIQLRLAEWLGRPLLRKLALAVARKR